MNMIGTTDHLRMAKSVLTDLRNRGFEEHASVLFAGDEEKLTWLDNIAANGNGQNIDRSPLDAGVVDFPSVGLIASIGPVYSVLTDVAETSEGGLAEVCSDLGVQQEGRKLLEQWLEEGKYILLINNMADDQAIFLEKQLSDLQGIDDLTIC